MEAAKGASPAGSGDVVDAILSWGEAVLALKQVERGGRLSLGEGGDLLIPAEVLGVERVEIMEYGGDHAVVIPPPGATVRVDGRARGDGVIELARGQVAEVAVGAFTVTLARVRPEPRLPPPRLRGEGAAFIAGSALFHAAAFAVVALFAPSLGATEEDPYDSDRLALMQRLLDASAQRENDRLTEDVATASGGGASAGQPAQGEAGAMGKPDTYKAGRWAERGDAKPEDATLARRRELALTEAYAFTGILSSSPASDPNAPVVPWGTTQSGSDDVSKAGNLFGRTIDDAAGMGVDAVGAGEGGGGNANAIGIDGVGGLGHGGPCTGGGPCDGTGSGQGHFMHGHPSRQLTMRDPGVTSNGRLPPEVIQRVVRLNSGRYRLCYQNALRTDPGLQGRVTVKFMIDRHGAVAFAADGGSDIPDEGVRRCVVSSFLPLSFPEPESGAVTVVYPLVFSPE